MGVMNSKTVDGMKRVGLGESAFERRFEVYSDDQVESRALLTIDFMERLLAMDQHAGRKTEEELQAERQAWYQERVSRVEAQVEAAMTSGILTGAPIPKWMTADAYDLIDSRLHGLLSPRF